MTILNPAVEFDGALIQKYDRPVPRYTSYPTAAEFSPQFDQHCFRRALQVANDRQGPLALYVHIPFCQSACYFCGCNVIVTQRQSIAQSYLECLQQEIRQMAAAVDTRRPVHQMHWGGGTPNYLSIDQVRQLWQTLTHHFQFAPEAEISIEVNPRYVDRAYIFALRQLGFNRISFGIQDFDPQVQRAVNRVQPEALLFEVMDWIRAADFESVNIDLIYGLPFQTRRSFQETIAKTLRLNPDRIAVFSFAYLPTLKPVQKKLPVAALPTVSEKLGILQQVIQSLTTNGYQYIGMDHFAKPEDELAIAQRRGTLKRNFQGYTTLPAADLIGLGLTSISMLEEAYAQNYKQLRSYFQAVAAGELPIERGVQLQRVDYIRRALIMELMCQFAVSKEAFSRTHGLDFDHYFQYELEQLRDFEQDGLVACRGDRLEVTPVGRLLVRNIAAVFDAYRQDPAAVAFSKAI
ncbi:oxygen-independent coproporphyrinogen III oxidase [Thermosynechococcaceae cyanobacterium Okahandja]